MADVKYREALARSLVDAMEQDERVLCLGVGVTDPKGVFGTTLEARSRFPDRVLETPLSENMLTGACVGLALEGWKPVLVHARCDFLMLTMEQLVNTAAKWNFSHGRDRPLPMVVRCIVGRGWGQGPQHSQAFHAMLCGVPGLRVHMPATIEHAQLSLQAALSSQQPTVVIEHRRLYEMEWARLCDPFTAPTRNASVTLVGISGAWPDVLEAQAVLAGQKLAAHVCVIQELAPLSIGRTIESALLTRNLVIADVGFAEFGISREIMARVLREDPGIKIACVAPPFSPCPTSKALEDAWYPGVGTIVEAACKLLGVGVPALATKDDSEFRGPF